MFYGSHTPLARPSVKQIENATSHKPSRGVKLTFNPPIAMGVLILHMARLAKWTSESCQMTKYSGIFKIMLLGQCLDVQMTTEEVPEMCRILKCNKTTRRNIIELKILPIFTHLCVIPNPYAFFFLSRGKQKTTLWRIFPHSTLDQFLDQHVGKQIMKQFSFSNELFLYTW